MKHLCNCYTKGTFKMKCDEVKKYIIVVKPTHKSTIKNHVKANKNAFSKVCLDKNSFLKLRKRCSLDEKSHFSLAHL